MDISKRAQSLRGQMTDAEKLIWRHLRGRRFARIKFRRQVPIAGYVVDFAALDLKLIVEIDGGQHAMRAAQDRSRTAILERSGYKVIRFWNHDVLGNLDGVLEVLLQEIDISR